MGHRHDIGYKAPRAKAWLHRYYRFCVRFFTSSSLTGCNMSLFGCPGVLPECPFDQSYDTEYAKIDPFRLNADEETGPGRGSNAVTTVVKKSIQDEARTKRSTFQACARVLVPEVDRPIRSCSLAMFKRNQEETEEQVLPQVENVPCTGWKLMSFTPNTSD